MSAFIVQKAEATGAESAAPSWPAATQEGNHLVARVSAFLNSGDGLIASAPAGWAPATFARAPRGVDGEILVAVFYYENAPSRSGSESFTVNTADEVSADGVSVQIEEWSGIAQSDSLDKTATANGSSTSASTGTTGTLAQANEMACGAIGSFLNVTFSSPTNGFTLEETTTRLAGLWKVVDSTTGVGTGVTLSSVSQWVGAIATFKAAAPEPPPDPDPEPVTFRRGRRRAGLPGVHLHLDGRPYRMEQDWLATERADFGYDTFTAKVPLADLRGKSVGQESEVVLYDDHGEVVWWGILDTDPQVADGMAELSAAGPGERALEAAQRFLFQTRDYALWADANDEPHGFPVNQKIEAEVRGGALFFRTPKGEDYASGQGHGLVLWAPGTPGGLSRIAFNIVGTGGTGNLRGRIQRFTGPTGSRTSATTHSLSDQPIEHVFATREDGVEVRLETVNSFTVASTNSYRYQNLRVNGIWENTGRASSWDVMYVDEGAAWAFDRLGWGKGGVEQRNVNVLPADFVGTDLAEVLSYFGMLVDFYWLAPLVPGGSGHFRSWGSRQSWSATSDTADFGELRAQRRYNIVVVPYTTVSGVDAEAEARATNDPFPGVDRRFVAPALEDPQPNDTLPKAVAHTYANQLSGERWAGAIDVAAAHADNGWENTRHIRPGDTITQRDVGPFEGRTHRVHAKEQGHDFVRLGVEDEASAEALIALTGLQRARKSRVRPAALARKRRLRGIA